MERITLIHTADVHLGLAAEAFGSRASQLRQYVRESFVRLMALCLESRADLLLIAGDLFDSPRPAQKTAEFGRAQLGRLGEADPPVQVVILPGTHDPGQPGSVYEEWLRLGLPPHLHLLTDPGGAPVSLLEGALLVHGGPGCLDLSASPEAAWNVGAIHASVQMGNLLDAQGPVLDPGRIAASGLNYLGLGHWHSFADYSTGGVTALYPGSPEILALDQTEAGQALRVTLAAGASPQVDRLPTGQLRREAVEINVADFANQDQLAEQLRLRGDPRLLLEVTLAGLAHATFGGDPEALAAELEGEFFRLRVRDRSDLAPEELSDLHYPPELVAGRFVRLMQDRVAAAEGDEAAQARERQALALGLALLEGKEVL